MRQFNDYTLRCIMVSIESKSDKIETVELFADIKYPNVDIKYEYYNPKESIEILKTHVCFRSFHPNIKSFILKKGNDIEKVDLKENKMCRNMMADTDIKYILGDGNTILIDIFPNTNVEIFAYYLKE